MTRMDANRQVGDCWVWQGARNSDGYGSMLVDGHVVGAHRVAYEAFVGPIPEGLHLDHVCRNPPCVNPAHLRPVTNAENMRRKVRQMADRLMDEEAARREMGGIGRTKYFELLRDGELRSVKIGRRRMVPTSEITRYIERHIADATPANEARP